jgi:hypothetical protein
MAGRHRRPNELAERQGLNMSVARSLSASGSILFFVGLHQVSDACHFDRSFISVNRLKKRVSDFLVNEWVMDSGAFSEISTFGEYRASEEEYAAQIDRWSRVGNFRAAATQDYMCEPWIVARTGKSVEEHQRLTLERYDRLRSLTEQPLLPVIQGFAPEEYVAHLDAWGSRLSNGHWVAVGSVCRRNKDPEQIENILFAIKRHRPDLRLHGFGLKITALASGAVRTMLYSADSMAWSVAARHQGRNANDWREAKAFESRVQELASSKSLIQGRLL